MAWILRRYWMALTMCLTALVFGCGGSAELTPATPRRAVYVDAKTMEAVVGEQVDELPALNPNTGQRTLMPALYCSSCRRWHHVPPPDQINRIAAAAKCPKTGTPLTADGPWPE